MRSFYSDVDFSSFQRLNSLATHSRFWVRDLCSAVSTQCPSVAVYSVRWMAAVRRMTSISTSSTASATQYGGRHACRTAGSDWPFQVSVIWSKETGCSVGRPSCPSAVTWPLFLCRRCARSTGLPTLSNNRFYHVDGRFSELNSE